MTTIDATEIDWAAVAQSIPLLDGESAWTEAEVRDIFTRLRDGAAQLRADIAADSADLSDLMADRAEAGVDQADTGSAAIEREQELALNHNLRDMLRQCEEALYRLESSRYGVCDSCGGPVGKARLQAFPRAVTCVQCKRREERRG